MQIGGKEGHPGETKEVGIDVHGAGGEALFRIGEAEGYYAETEDGRKGEGRRLGQG